MVTDEREHTCDDEEAGGRDACVPCGEEETAVAEAGRGRWQEESEIEHLFGRHYPGYGSRMEP